MGIITEYICTWCGKKVKRAKGEGRPEPGYCPRKPKSRRSNNVAAPLHFPAQTVILSTQDAGPM